MDFLKNLWYKISWEPKEGVVYHSKRNVRIGLVDRGTITECLFVDRQNKAYASSFMVKKDKNEVEIRIRSKGRRLQEKDVYNFMIGRYPIPTPTGSTSQDIASLRDRFKKDPKPPTLGYNPKSDRAMIFQPSELDFRKKRYHYKLSVGGQGKHGKDIRIFFYIVEQKKEGMET